jgi:hypothetical protein
MRTRNALERLTSAGLPLLAAAESLVDAAEEERILEWIFASSRPAARRIPSPRLRLALVGVAVVAVAAVVAAIDIGHSAPRGTGNQHVALNGAKLQLAGYHFRTPAGFTASSTACASAHRTGQPTTMQNFAAAASADGGCVEAFVMISSSGSAVPADATPVDVGSYQGYITTDDSSQQLRLYVELPPLGGDFDWQAVVLFSQGLTTDQLIAVAQSGLPATPSATFG